MDAPTNHTKISLNVPDELLAEIDAEAQRQVRNRSQMIIVAVADYLKQLPAARLTDRAYVAQEI